MFFVCLFLCMHRRLGQYVVAADERWVCVFDESWRRLGCDIPGRGERTVAWENIAVSISSARRHRLIYNAYTQLQMLLYYLNFS